MPSWLLAPATAPTTTPATRTIEQAAGGIGGAMLGLLVLAGVLILAVVVLYTLRRLVS